MKKSNLISFLLLFVLGIVPAFGQGRPALKAVPSKGPNIDESVIALEMPYQYYYFTKEVVDGAELPRLHCYYPKTEVDVTLDLPIYDWSYIVEGSWYDKVNDCAYIAVNSGGLEVRQLSIYKITKDNTISEEMELVGYTPRAYNDYDTSMQCYAEVGDQFIRIKGYKDGEEVNGFFNYDLTPVTLSSLTNVNLTPLNIGFVRVNADGVNVRKSPNPKAPRLGYFYCPQCEDTDYENPLLWEDDPEGKKPFTPYHPMKGSIEYYHKENSNVDGWHPFGGNQYVSDKFVDEVVPVPISVNSDIDDDSLYIINRGKYTGLCIYMQEDGMDIEGLLYFGKIDDSGIIQFYGTCKIPHHYCDIKGLQWIDDGFYYGSDYEKPYDWGYGPLDLKKLTTTDIDLLMSKSKPVDRIELIFVSFPEYKSFFYL